MSTSSPLEGARTPDLMRVGGGFAAAPPTLEAQLATAKQRILELWAQLEQRTRQLTAMQARLTGLVKAHHEASEQAEALGRRLAAEQDEKERVALQLAQMRDGLQAASAERASAML